MMIDITEEGIKTQSENLEKKSIAFAWDGHLIAVNNSDGTRNYLLSNLKANSKAQRKDIKS